MSAPVIRTLELLDGRTEPLRFTALAAFIVQKETGLTLDELLSRIQSGRASVFEMTALLFGELEGARRKARAGGIPWSIDRVADLADDSGDIADFFMRHAAVITQTFLDSMPKIIKAANDKASEALAKAQEAAAGDPPDAGSTSTAT